jgi:hypothetical protein
LLGEFKTKTAPTNENTAPKPLADKTRDAAFTPTLPEK